MLLLLLVSYLNIKGCISSDHIYQDKLLHCTAQPGQLLDIKRQEDVFNMQCFQVDAKDVHLIIIFFTEGIVHCSRWVECNTSIYYFKTTFRLKYVNTVQSVQCSAHSIRLNLRNDAFQSLRYYSLGSLLSRQQTFTFIMSHVAMSKYG